MVSLLMARVGSAPRARRRAAGISPQAPVLVNIARCGRVHDASPLVDGGSGDANDQSHKPCPNSIQKRR